MHQGAGRALSDSEKVVYNRTHAPWPVADRDAVLHNIARFDAAAERVELDFWSVEDAKEPPVKGVVRMPFLRGHWICHSRRSKGCGRRSSGGTIPSSKRA